MYGMVYYDYFSKQRFPEKQFLDEFFFVSPKESTSLHLLLCYYYYLLEFFVQLIVCHVLLTQDTFRHTQQLCVSSI